MIKMHIDEDGDEVWYDADVRDVHDVGLSTELHWHRLDGPAFTGSKHRSWWINNQEYRNFKDFQKAGGLSDEEMCILRLKYGSI